MKAKEKIQQSENVVIISEAKYFTYINEAKEVFKRYKDAGTIITDSFNDDQWVLFNGVSRKSISFQLDQIKYEYELRSRGLISYDDFINAYKCYFLLILQETAMNNCIKKMNTVKRILILTNYLEKREFTKIFGNVILRSSYIRVFHHILNFFDFVEMSIDNDIREMMESEISKYNNFERRTNRVKRIPSFLSITKFENIIAEFISKAEEAELDKFIPIVLWWRITTIIPLRPTEFTLIPYDCIWTEEEKYYLKVRRSKLKGKKKEIYHNIDEDYFFTVHRIDYATYQLINRCRDRGDHYDDIFGYQREFLLSYIQYKMSFHYIYWHDQSDYKTERVDLNRLEKILRLFYKDIVFNKYGYELTQEGDPEDFTSKLIEKITLLDARHIAIINMVMDKVETSTVAELSGHTSMNTAFGYYNHATQMVKSAVVRTAYKIKNYSINSAYDPNIVIDNAIPDFHMALDRNINEILHTKSKYRSNEVRNGKCISSQKEINDCIKVEMKCILCPWFIPSNKYGKEELIKQYKENEIAIDEALIMIDSLLRFKVVENLVNEKVDIHFNRIRTALNQNLFIILKNVKEGYLNVTEEKV